MRHGHCTLMKAVGDLYVLISVSCGFLWRVVSYESYTFQIFTVVIKIDREV